MIKEKESWYLLVRVVYYDDIGQLP